jgi:putative acetyltransferase
VVTIRPETPADEAPLDALLESAFGGPQVPRLTRMIRRSPEYEPELALVAEDDTGSVGFVLFSRLPLLSPDGRWWSVLVLSPLAVRPDRAGIGIGSALMRHGLSRADNRGEALVVLEGDPGYYVRFGFERSSARGIERPSDLIPQDAFQVRTLAAYEKGMRGRVVYPAAFWRCNAVGPGT